MKKFQKIIITCSLLAFTTAIDAKQKYVIFVDAGSSGSRLHLFSYDTNNTNIPVIADLFSEHVKPGISSYENQPELAGQSLKELFDKTSRYLTSHHIPTNTVPVNILATAGMRLISTEKQHAIYRHITHYLQSHYDYPISRVETISGKKEGLYGWLDVNYLLKNFQHHTPTVGSIDIGGASTQIAFATDDTTTNKHKINITIGHDQYTVFSKSFLGLGQDQIRNKMLNAAHPEVCYPQNYPLASEIPLQGHFQFESCAQNYMTQIQLYQVSEQLIPHNDQNFIAYSGIYHDYQFLQTDKTPDQINVEMHINMICHKTWDQLHADYPQIPEIYLASYCANSVYVDQLVNNIYKISAEKLTVTDQIDGKDLDWTLGAVLYSAI